MSNRKAHVMLAGGLFLAGIVLVLRAPFQQLAESAHQFVQACAYLRANNLPVNQEYRELYRAFVSPAATWPDFQAPSRSSGLLANVRSISVYLQPPPVVENLEPRISGLIQRAAESGVSLSILGDEQEFLGALRRDDLVIYSGHANHGRGLGFAADSNGWYRVYPIPGANPVAPRHGLRPDDEIMEEIDEQFVRIRTPSTVPGITSITCRVFVHLGCRTDVYYRKPLVDAHPNTAFVLTRYTWAPHFRIVDALDILVAGVESGAAMEDVLDRWEIIFRDMIIPGQIIERDAYGISGPFPSRLFKLHHPGALSP